MFSLLFVTNEWTKEFVCFSFGFGFLVSELMYANAVTPIRYGQKMAFKAFV
jgi:hypothetical protein